jgi:hypothetical protein
MIDLDNMIRVVIPVEGDCALRPSLIDRNYWCSGKDKALGYLFMTMVLTGLRSFEDDHDSLYVGVAIFVILLGAILPLLSVAALRLVLVNINDIFLVSVAVPGRVVHHKP